MNGQIDTLVSLAAVEQAEHIASLYQLFESECLATGDPLTESQRLAFMKSVAVQSHDSRRRLADLFTLDQMVRSLRAS